MMRTFILTLIMFFALFLCLLILVLKDTDKINSFSGTNLKDIKKEHIVRNASMYRKTLIKELI